MGKIPFKQTDKKYFELRFCPGFPKSDLMLELHQIDILKIVKGLSKLHNNHLQEKFKKFINYIDHTLDENTDFERKLPRGKLK